jgi:hypothetical protein
VESLDKIFYTYLLVFRETGEFYIGSRGFKGNPINDKYMGSMNTWQVDKSVLHKTILSCFDNREEALQHEADLILNFIKDPLNRNYYIPNKGFYNKGGNTAWNKKSIDNIKTKYDLSKFIYVDNKTKGEAICSKHGSFFITPYKLNNRGQGCRECYLESKNKPLSNTGKFIEKAKLKHNNRYLYDKVEYNGQMEKVIITCVEHGDFLQKPKQHLKGQGCRKCRDKYFSESKCCVRKKVLDNGTKI